MFWSSRKLKSLRGTGASALPPLTIFRSLSALQQLRNCTQRRHRPQPSRRRCIILHTCAASACLNDPLPRPAPLPPARELPLNESSSSFCRRCCLATTAVAHSARFFLSLRITQVLKRSDAYIHFLSLSQTLNITNFPLVSEVNTCIALVARGGCARLRRTARLLNHNPFTAAFQDNAVHRGKHAFQNQLPGITA